jgi:hypothetical protein
MDLQKELYDRFGYVQNFNSGYSSPNSNRFHISWKRQPIPYGYTILDKSSEKEKEKVLGHLTTYFLKFKEDYSYYVEQMKLCIINELIRLKRPDLIDKVSAELVSENKVTFGIVFERRGSIKFKPQLLGAITRVYLHGLAKKFIDDEPNQNA